MSYAMMMITIEKSPALATQTQGEGVSLFTNDMKKHLWNDTQDIKEKRIVFAYFTLYMYIHTLQVKYILRITSILSLIQFFSLILCVLVFISYPSPSG